MSVRVDKEGMAEFFGALDSGVQKATLAGASVYQAELKMKLGRNHGGVPSLPGNPPNSQTGDLSRSITVKSKEIGTAQIGPNVPYGVWLEFGTTKMAARPFVRPVAADKRIGDRVTAKVAQTINATVSVSVGTTAAGGAP